MKNAASTAPAEDGQRAAPVAYLMMVNGLLPDFRYASSDDASAQVLAHFTLAECFVNSIKLREFEAKEKEQINPSQSQSLPKPPYLTIA